MKMFKSSISQTISMIILGWIFCFVWVMFENKINVDVMIGISMIAVVIFVIVINKGTYLKLENDTLTWVRTYKERQSVDLRENTYTIN